MVLDLRGVFSADNGNRAFDFVLDLSSLEFGGVHPFSSSVEVTGMVRNRAGVVKAEGQAAFSYEAPCDRCAESVVRSMTVPFSYIVVEEESGDDHDFVVVQDGRLDIGRLVIGDIVLSIPVKFLCREDCGGLCLHCGSNLNDGSCSCETHAIDPRLEALKKLID